jgi:hypothetical protein
MVTIFSSNLIASIFATVLTVPIGTMMMPLTTPNAGYAEDKSTSISCDGVGMCEKTECVDGSCNTSPTNSSSIVDSPSPLSNTTDQDSNGAGNATNTSLTPLDQRMGIRENLKK